MKRLCVLLLAACGGSTPPTSTPTDQQPAAQPQLTIVAESVRKWTGVTVDDAGTLFVNYPRWSDDVPISVARLVDGEPEPFPDAEWNAWARGRDPATHWVCVQSVVVDAQGRLWVLDPGNPGFGGVIEGAPKLVRFDLPSREPAQTIRFEAPTIQPGSYLNDVRFDLERGVAFITDSGDGALVVVDLATGQSRRVLDDHASTEAEDIVLTIQGRTIDMAVHSDGIAYDPQGDYVYYQALRGRTLYRVSGAALRDETLSTDALATNVERVAESGASDGLLFLGGRVYLSALEHDAIRAVVPGTGEHETIVDDPRISWPDTFAARPGATHLYFTTAQIHISEPDEPHRIFRLELE